MALIDIKRELDLLFATLPAEFVASRNALAKRLKSAGLAELATEVKGLARPTPTCWAVNRLKLDAPDVLERMVEAGRTLRVAQQSAPRDVDSAKAIHRTAIAGAADHATALLTAAGYVPNALASRRLRETLEALASGSADGEAGRLSRDLEPPGFDAFELAQRAGIAKEARDAAAPNAVARRRSSHSLAAVVGRRRSIAADDPPVEVDRATEQTGVEPRAQTETDSPKRPEGVPPEDKAQQARTLEDRTPKNRTPENSTPESSTPDNRARENRALQNTAPASAAAHDARERHAVLAEALATVEAAHRQHQLELEEAEALVAGLRDRLERAEAALAVARETAEDARDKRDRVKRQSERAEAELRALEGRERTR